MIKAVVMAGGSGTRLWPMSRSIYPKQFLKLTGNHSMLQSTIKRLQPLNISSSVIVCNEEHRFLVAEQLREIDEQGSIILEPMGKNTAPSIALAAFLAKNDPLLLVLAADHVIKDNVGFKNAVNKAIPLAESGKLVTFGIVPSKAHVGYGYIKKGTRIDNGFIVDKFVEKPTKDVAHEYVESKAYLWNSGMFMFKASRYLEELKEYRPDIYEACKASVINPEKDMDFTRIDADKFEACMPESIDCAIMEKTSEAVVVPMDLGWSDIGSWTSLWEISSKDEKGNSSQGDVTLHNSKECFVRAENKFVSAIGLNEIVIIDTKDALLVAHKDSVQDTKIIVEQLKEKGRSEWESHREVFRPWGKYDSIDKGHQYHVKRITVNPGAKLSVQKHKHRSEHWIVVSGCAKVTNDDKIFILQKNESTYIPVGAIHSLENPGKDNLELIEVQSGSYLGEDDIVRYEDIYGRVKD